MIHFLLGLCLLPHLAGAAMQTYSDGAKLDLTTCPITYFGIKYTSLFVERNVGNDFYACFDALRSAGGVDCLTLPSDTTSSTTFTAEIGVSLSVLDERVKSAHSTIKTASICGVHLNMRIGNSEGYTDIYFMNFGTQAALYIDGYIEVPQNTVQFISVNVAEQDNSVFSHRFNRAASVSINDDISGCRKDGSVYSTALAFTDGDTCVKDVCTVTGDWESGSTCTGSAQCLGNNICGNKKFCSVIGPSVIDFSLKHGAVPDFCNYNLLTRGVLSVKGYFRGRRTTDVPFLDEVALKIGSGDTIILQQGGVVMELNGNGGETVLSLTSSPTTFAGFLLSSDENGVTASNTDSNNVQTTILFDGTLLHITQIIPSNAPSGPSGLCIDRNSVSSSKDLTSSAAGCDAVVRDSDTSGIDCSAVNSRCNAFALSPCNVDSSGHIDACKHIFCHYPDVDELYCDLLHSFSISCGKTDWMDATGCAAPACLGHVCGYNEFCGVTSVGDTACLCRDTFAAKYKAANKYGDPTTCTDANHGASVTLYTCFLEEIGVDYTGLSLTDPSCTGVHDANANTVTFSFDDAHTCGTILSADGSQIVMKNRITNAPSDVITREDQATFTFSCAYNPPDTQTVALKISENSVTQTLVSGDFTFSLTMKAFSNAALSQAVSQSTSLKLNQALWIQLEATGIDTTKLALVMDNCWATSDPSPTSANRYDLITAGCSDPADVEVLSNGESVTTAFTYHVFQFVGSSGDVYLHCEVNLCIKANSCVPDCTGLTRRRRSVQEYANESPALITMAWTN